MGAIASIPLIAYLPFLEEPFFRDEGLYAAVAQGIRHGEIPYQDAFDNKPPVVFGWYALSFALFGEEVWAPRLMVAILLSGTTLLMYVQGRMMFSHRAGLVAAAAFGASTALATLETNANTEFYMVPMIVGSLACYTAGRKHDQGWGWFVPCGFLSGFAMMTKQISLFVFAFYILYSIVGGLGERSLPKATREVAALIGGCATSFAVVIVPFVVTGTFDDMWDAVVVYAFTYAGGPTLESQLVALVKSPLYLLLILGPWLTLGGLGLWSAWRGRVSQWGWLLGGFLAANWIGIIAAGRFVDHYYFTLLPGLSLLVPVGLAFILNRQAMSRAGAALAVTIVATSAIAPLVQNFDIYAQPGYAERHEAKYSTDPRAVWESESPALAAWLKERTSTNDKIYNFGFQSELYFYADRRYPTRYLSDRPFWLSDEHVERAIRELTADPPLYVIDSAIHEVPTPEKVYTQEVKDWILENYDFVGKIYYADVYRLKGSE